LNVMPKCTLCGGTINLANRNSYQVDWSAEDTMGRFYFHNTCVDGRCDLFALYDRVNRVVHGYMTKDSGKRIADLP
jgi:hypothetical protein